MNFSHDYWQAAIGGAYVTRAGIGKHEGSHPMTVRRVLDVAKTACPEAADVIASLVFANCSARNHQQHQWKTIAALEAENARLRAALAEMAAKIEVMRDP